MSFLTEFDAINLNESQPTTDTTFKIPKKAKTGLLQAVDDEQSFDYKLIIEEIKQSFLDKQTNELGYALTKIQYINNVNLENQYTNHKKERMKLEEFLWNRNPLKKGKKGKIVEKTVFFVSCNEEEAFEIAKSGFKCNDDDNFLADGSQGIHFCKHLDILLKYQYSRIGRTKQLNVILAKVFYDPNKLEQRKASMNNKTTTPKTGCDGFASIIELSDKKDLFSSYFESLVYIYELDETLSSINEPKNMRPHAILTYELKDPSNRSLFKLKHTRNCAISKAFNNKTRYFNNVFVNQEVDKAQKKLTNREIKPKPETLQADFIPFDSSHVTISDKIPDEMPSPSLNYNNFVQQIKQKQQKELEKSQKTEQASTSLSKETSDACRLVKNFKPVSPKKDASIYDDDDEEVDDLKLLEEYFALYADRFKEADEKMPKWRVIYERNGNLDTIFYGSRRMECRVNNIKNLGFLYSDQNKSILNVNQPTNKIILQYQSKRFKSKNINNNINIHESGSIITKYVKKDDLDHFNNIKSCIFIPGKQPLYVNIDFSYLPVCRIIKTRSIESNKTEQIESIKTEPILPKTSTVQEHQQKTVSRQDIKNRLFAKSEALKKKEQFK